MASPFDAKGSLLGYVYQIRVGLLDALRRLRYQPQFLVRLEALDDVSFEGEGTALEVLQTKHHLSAEASLTDGSADLWKTLRVWIHGRSSGAIPEDGLLLLATTATASDGSAAAYLRAGPSRDVPRAAQRLRATAATSKNDATATARAAFTALGDGGQESLLDLMTVLDSYPAVDAIGDLIAAELIHAAPGDKLVAFASRLEGWWFRRVVKHLVSSEQGGILSEELVAEIADLREQFKRNNLPIDDDEDLLHAFDEGALSDRAFVEQLRIIDLGGRRLLFAMQDYFKAFQQRSRWMRDDLLYVGEISRYEKRLIDEWERRFEQMRYDCGPRAVEEEKKRLAEQLYRWVENDANFHIRRDCVEPFVTRGSLHMLADAGQVGWHLEFRERLGHLFEEMA